LLRPILMPITADKAEALLIVTMALLIARAEIPSMARMEAHTDKVVTQLMVQMEHRIAKAATQLMVQMERPTAAVAIRFMVQMERRVGKLVVQRTVIEILAGIWRCYV
jgi:hypothetical protein